MRNLLQKRLLISTAAATMLFGSAITANAAQEDLFDAEYYAETYPDVVAEYGNDADTLLEQYLGSGITEGRSANAYFNALAYKTANTDLAAAFGDDWDAYADHYIEYGVAEGRYTGGVRAITDEEYAAALAKMTSSASTSQTQQSTQSTKTSTTSSSGVSRNAADYRSISSLSELTPYPDTSAFWGNRKTMEKVAYTHNGVTVLLYDMVTVDDGEIALYDFTNFKNADWKFTFTSNLDKKIEAGGSAVYSDIKYWSPIVNYQLYTDSVTLEELQAAQGDRPYEEALGITRNISDYRSISSLSELTYYSHKDIPADEMLEKVAYTHNGVTVLLYDMISDGDIALYDFTGKMSGSIFNTCAASGLDEKIDAGGWTVRTSYNGVDWVDEWISISRFQLY
ncbi:MAG: hypothetical protein LUE96_06200 [Lachnospiraceae bacterium]|nr:hypothetical protein [Lachnospiraceae bacterium]